MLIQNSVEVDRTHLQRGAQVHCMCQVDGVATASHEDRIDKLEIEKTISLQSYHRLGNKDIDMTKGQKCM